MRYVIGYLACLAFIVLILTFFGFFPDVIRNNESNVGTFFNFFSNGRHVSPAVQYTVSVFGLSFSPALALGHFVAIVLSPIGLFTLVFYSVLIWMLPAR
ncbi:MAG TPA: hypothetical protein VJT32_07105 [bacterium]|nr:hypothetical protein [bacterium]